MASARRLIVAGEKITDLGYDTGDPPAAMTAADDLLLAVRRQSVGSTLVTPEDRVKMLNERYDRLMKEPETVGVKTGLMDLDRQLGGGFFAGELVILGARPSVGKTTLLSTIANHVAREQKVLFATAEMSIADVGDRDIAGLTGIPMSTVRLGSYDPDDYAKIMEALHLRLGELQVYYYRDLPLTTSKIQQAAMSMQIRHGLDLVVIDYLGLLSDGDGENQNIKLGNMSRRLKVMAQMLEVPVLVAHQLSRGLEHRPDKEPRLADLRESGHLEEDADVVMLLYRDEPNEVTKVLVPKMRQGDKAMIAVKIVFDHSGKRYVSLAREE
jgi:replicative DNA helicase